MAKSIRSYGGTVVRVCVDEFDPASRRVGGRIFSRWFSEPVPFSDLSTLLLQVERMLDRLGFPQAYERKRDFRQERGHMRSAEHRPEAPFYDEAAFEALLGRAATFCVAVETRKNTTWQGSVNWLDGVPPARFVSALELLRLMDERIFA